MQKIDVHNGLPKQIARAMTVLRLVGDKWDSQHPNDSLKQLHPEAGPLLWSCVLASGHHRILEIGCGSGYSTLWLASALCESGGYVIALDPDTKRVAIARDFAVRAGLEKIIRFFEIRLDETFLQEHCSEGVGLVFLDCWKEDYAPSLRAVLPYLKRGSMVLADNIISHASRLEDFAALVDDLVQSGRAKGGTVAIGEGILVLRVER